MRRALSPGKEMMLMVKDKNTVSYEKDGPPLFKRSWSYKSLEESFWKASAERLVDIIESVIPNDDTTRIRHRKQVRKAICGQLMNKELANKFLKVHDARKTVLNKKLGVGIPNEDYFLFKRKGVDSSENTFDERR